MTSPQLRFFEHDADEGFEVEAGTLAEIWDLSVVGLLEVMTDVSTVRRGVATWVEVDAPDLAALLVESLTEVLYRFEVDGQLSAGVDGWEHSETPEGVRARFRVLGETFDPGRHAARSGVKAVTHHGARIERTSTGWRARILLDL